MPTRQTVITIAGAIAARSVLRRQLRCERVPASSISRPRSQVPWLGKSIWPNEAERLRTVVAGQTVFRASANSPESFRTRDDSPS